MTDSVKGALLTMFGGMCWGVSGCVGQYLFTSGLQHTPHAQRLGNLKIVDRIPDHNSLRRYGTALLQFRQISQADFHFAAGVNIIQPQQAVKVGAHSALRDLLFQNRQVGSRKN